MKPKKHLIFMGMIVIILSACGLQKTSTVESGNPGKMVSQLEKDLDTARANQLNVLAPEWYDKAQTYYSKAKASLDKGEKMSDIGEYVSEANISLGKAEEIAKVSRTILGKVSEARQKALNVGAEKLGEPFMDVENKYLKLSKAIENDNISYAQENSTKVQAAFRNVEIMAIKANALGDVRKMLAEAEQDKMYKIAPQAYGAAEQSLSEADDFIAQNPYDNDMIKQKTAAAEFQARRMMAVTESSKKFKEMEPEESAIYLESLLGSLSQTIGTGDIRDKRVEEQFDQLIAGSEKKNQTTASLKSDNTRYLAQIGDLENRLDGLKGFSSQQEEAKNRLSAEREFSELFNKVQRSFDPDEAEVYKQGGQMVIRLRGINFPVGQSTLKPENYILLSKVQQAIQTFGEPSVTIEGHTDSTGSKQTNQSLSQMRAMAVKTYLVANKTLPSDRIQAKGYGPDRPLAPDTTPEGRAANRRIDVLINPAKTH
ncbi:MAG: OmpA family protein [Proteobacteria bacterium]|nr:OmpA family protein [Pseudomonadota bacterium]